MPRHTIIISLGVLVHTKFSKPLKPMLLNAVMSLSHACSGDVINQIHYVSQNTDKRIPTEQQRFLVSLLLYFTLVSNGFQQC